MLPDASRRSPLMTTPKLHRRRRPGASLLTALLLLATGPLWTNLALLAGLSPGSGAGAAQAAAPAQDATGYWAVVTANDVHVRSGPSVDAAYPFLKLERGALVKVTEENVGWARVPAIGPTFKEAFGYIKADRKVRVAADGRTAEILSTVDVFAPNQLARFAPDSSWKAIGQLEPGRTVAILDTIEGQRERVHKVRLGETCEGWLNLTFLRPATEQELAGIDVRTGRPRETAPPSAPSGEAVPGAQQGATATVTVIDAEEVVDAANLEVVERETVVIEQGRAPAPTTPPTASERVAQVRLADLEAALDRLRREDPATAEVGPLRQRYLEFADRPATSASERQVALARAEQLAIQEEAQVRLQQVQALLNRNMADLEIIRNARQTMDARQPYIAVGRLNASTVYDGVRLPLLFRVQDPAGGQTIGYIEPGKGFDLTAMLGQLVGVVGKQGYDPALRVNIIEPTRIDVLGVRR